MKSLKQFINFRSGVLIASALGVGLFLSGAAALSSTPPASPADAQDSTAPKTNEQSSAQSDIQKVAERLPDQADAMVDVGYHFTNLWFAGDKQNWPLARYYLSVTRAKLRWAVLIHPVRKTAAGADVDLNGILRAVDDGFLAELNKSIEKKDAAGFKAAYRQSLGGCYVCHQACEKPYLRPRVPTAPSTLILDFSPGDGEQR